MNTLIIGALPKTPEEEFLYINLTNIIPGTVSTPIETANFVGTDQERYKRAFEKVNWADLIIAEASRPSTGQGMELREAINQKKKIIVITKQGNKVSGLITGCPDIQDIIFYKGLEDLQKQIITRLQ